MKRVESVKPPSHRSARPFDQACHGTTVPVQVGTFDTGGEDSPIIQAFKDVAGKQNLPLHHDLSCGKPRVVSQFPVTVAESGERCDAARAWLLPIQDRENAMILVGHYVGKVLLNQTNGALRAIGVQYGRYRGNTYEVYAAAEVIVSAGALGSPLILESSGIGLSEVLANAGIDQVVDLPVGLNHQDQTNTNVVNLPTAAASGQGQIAYFASFNETLGDQSLKGHALLRNDTILRQWADAVVASGGFHDASMLMVQYRSYRNHVQHHDIAYAELLLDTWGDFGFSVWNLLPFGRGYIHVRSSDPYLRDYDYSPQFLYTELDVLAQASASRLARALVDDTKLATFRQKELRPGLDEVSGSDDIESWARWVKANYRPNLHAVGTCSMMRQDLGGVVNERAQVYGVDRLRVVDASIVPTQVSSHMMALLYDMADKIAAYIQDDYAKFTEQNGHNADSIKHDEL